MMRHARTERPFSGPSPRLGVLGKLVAAAITRGFVPPMFYAGLARNRGEGPHFRTRESVLRSLSEFGYKTETWSTGIDYLDDWIFAYL